MEGREWLNMGIISISVAVIASVLFGIVFGVPLWYSYALRCAIFAPLGYWFAKREPFKEILPKNNKILSYILLIASFTLAFLFVFGMIFVVWDLAGTTLSSVIPFAIALVLVANWDCFKKTYRKPRPISNEDDIPPAESEDVVDTFSDEKPEVDSDEDSDEKVENYIDDAS